MVRWSDARRGAPTSAGSPARNRGHYTITVIAQVVALVDVASRGHTSGTIAVVILFVVAVARVPSVNDQREKEAQGHDGRGDQEDDQTELAPGIAPGLARQPAEDLSLTARPHDWALRNTHRNTTAPTPAKA